MSSSSTSSSSSPASSAAMILSSTHSLVATISGGDFRMCRGGVAGNLLLLRRPRRLFFGGGPLLFFGAIKYFFNQPLYASASSLLNGLVCWLFPWFCSGVKEMGEEVAALKATSWIFARQRWEKVDRKEPSDSA